MRLLESSSSSQEVEVTRSGCPVSFIESACNQLISCAGTGQLYSSGWNKNGQLGHSQDLEGVVVPQLVTGLPNQITKVSCGWNPIAISGQQATCTRYQLIACTFYETDWTARPSDLHLL